VLRILRGHTSYVTSVAVNGNTVVSGSADRTVRVWDLSDGTLLRTLTASSCAGAGHTACVASVAISPDGDRIVSGSADGTIKVWNPSDGTLLRTLPVPGGGDAAHTGGVRSVAISPDGNRIASGGLDATIKLWSLTEGSLEKTLAAHGNTVWSVAISSDGGSIVSGGGDARVIRWGVYPPLKTLTPPSAVEGNPRQARATLSQNVPNPFNPSTSIPYSLASDGVVRLELYDAIGRPVRTLLADYRHAGEHSVVWDGRDDAGRAVASGVYVVRMVASGFVTARKVTLLR